VGNICHGLLKILSLSSTFRWADSFPEFFAETSTFRFSDSKQRAIYDMISGGRMKTFAQASVDLPLH